MSNAAGMFSGALMTVSLLAVPCVAVFGLPAVGGTATEAEAKDGIALGGELGTAAAGTIIEAPAFAPVVDAGAVTSASSAPTTKAAGSDEPHHLAPTSDRRGAAANMAVGLPDDTRHSAAAAESGRTANLKAVDALPPANIFAETDPVAHGDAAVRQPAVATWEDAVTRLGEFGIRDFRLTNGDVAGEFHFSCSVKDAGRNLTRRFEAEAATPVAAAADVLAQVETCFGTR